MSGRLHVFVKGPRACHPRANRGDQVAVSNPSRMQYLGAPPINAAAASDFWRLDGPTSAPPCHCRRPEGPAYSNILDAQLHAASSLNRNSRHHGQTQADVWRRHRQPFRIHCIPRCQGACLGICFEGMPIQVTFLVYSNFVTGGQESEAFKSCDVEFVPVFLGGIMKSTGNRPPLVIKSTTPDRTRRI